MAAPIVISAIKASVNSVLVNETNLASGIIYRHKEFLTNPMYWHRFVVANTEGLERDEVLKAILNHVHPLDLIPVFYTKDQANSCAYFMARNCGAAIEKLCKDKLTINNPMNTGNQTVYKPFKISIILCFSTTNDFKIDVQKNVRSVLTRRYDTQTKTLDLSKFHEDAELTEFCPLFQPKIMFFVLHISKTFCPENIILSGNDIKLLNPMEALLGGKIQHVDLSDNLIKSFSDLEPLRPLKIKELKLSGNPLCAEYSVEEYIEKVKSLSPDLVILDYIMLKQHGFPMVRKNYLCDPQGFNLVNQFLEYFFTLYDSRNRLSLENLYHINAMFSLTSQYHPYQQSSQTANMRDYATYSRNLTKLADLSKTYEYLFRDRKSILNFISRLPLTDHDPYSFSVDLMYYSPLSAVIVVNGVFKELTQNLLDPERYLGFTRSFVLEIRNESECKIVNEQLHVYNALTGQQMKSFPIQKHLKSFEVLSPTKASERLEAVQTIRWITNLKLDWARKCLEEHGYDLKSTLRMFMELYKADKFPQDAFVDS